MTHQPCGPTTRWCCWPRPSSQCSQPTSPDRSGSAIRPSHVRLAVEYDLPASTVISPEKGYKYTVGTDTIAPVARSAAEAKKLYADVIANTSLAVLQTLFTEDRYRSFDTLVFNGMVDAVDPATGVNIRPCLVTVRTTREVFEQLSLGNVDPAACLRHLGASVSKSPAELTPVRPVLEFSMVDPRFVSSTDVLGALDTRANLMELSPSEFENLITNLFEHPDGSGDQADAGLA